MDIRPIRNDADHKPRSKRLKRLWDAAEGTREADRMEVLAILVEDYENKALAVPASTPLEILNYAVSEMGRSQSEPRRASRLAFTRLGAASAASGR